MRGKGKVTITGQLGDVMKESALAALTWIRANAKALGLDARDVRGERLPHPRSRGRDPQGRPLGRRHADLLAGLAADRSARGAGHWP